MTDRPDPSGDWYDEIQQRRRKARERLGLPEWDTAPVVKSDKDAPRDAASRYLLALGETVKRKRLNGVRVFSCGCLVWPPIADQAREIVGPACVKHRGKVS